MFGIRELKNEIEQLKSAVLILQRKTCTHKFIFTIDSYGRKICSECGEIKKYLDTSEYYKDKYANEIEELKKQAELLGFSIFEDVKKGCHN